MAIKAACALTLLGRAQAVLSGDCTAAVDTFFNANTEAAAAPLAVAAAGEVNAQSPKCTLPLAAGLETQRWTTGEDGSLFTTRVAADKVCPAISELAHKNMCSDPCEGYLSNIRDRCAGESPVAGDEGTLPDDGVSGVPMTLTWWTQWFWLMNNVETLCQNECLAYYCANKDRTGFEALSPACSTTTTTVTGTVTGTSTATETVTDTSTATSTIVENVPGTGATTMAPVAPTTQMSTIAPGAATTQAAVVVAPAPAEAIAPAVAPAAIVAPQGSMPANLAVAKVVGAAGLLNTYSQPQLVHPGWIVGVMGILGGVVALIVVKRRTSPLTEELEGLTTAE